jgi:hypothetical protein
MSDVLPENVEIAHEEDVNRSAHPKTPLDLFERLSASERGSPNGKHLI